MNSRMIQGLEPRMCLSSAVYTPGFPGTITVTGTDGPDTIVVTVKNTDFAVENSVRVDGKLVKLPNTSLPPLVKVNAKGGNDTVTFNGSGLWGPPDEPSTVVTIKLGTGNDAGTVFSDGARIEVSGESGDDTIRAVGSTGDVMFHGNVGNDKLFGGSGNDRLYGDAGNDYLAGNAGNDRFWGGLGNDACSGGDDYDRSWIGEGGKDYNEGMEVYIKA